MAHNISFRRIDRPTVAQLTNPGENQLQPGMWGYATQEEVFVIRTREGEFKFIPGRGLNIIGTFEGFPPSDANLAKIGNLCLVNNAVLGGQTLNGVLYQYQIEASGRSAWQMVGQIQGPKGTPGIDGKPFTIKGNYPTLVDLEDDHLEGAPGDFWTVGDADSGETLYLYTWNEPTDSWVRLGNIRGMRGLQGLPGVTPAIGANGNWVIDGADTGKPARPHIELVQEDGIQVEYWFIGTTNTNVRARGPRGFRGLTPTIGENGNWFIEGEDSGSPSRGEAGDTPEINAAGNWQIGGVDTGIKADWSGSIEDINLRADAETRRATERENEIETGARRIDVEDNGNGSFRFTDFDGESKDILSGKRLSSTDGTVQIDETISTYDLSIRNEISRAEGRESGIESSARQIALAESESAPGKLGFTDYNGNYTEVQGGFTMGSEDGTVSVGTPNNGHVDFSIQPAINALQNSISAEAAKVDAMRAASPLNDLGITYTGTSVGIPYNRVSLATGAIYEAGVLEFRAATVSYAGAMPAPAYRSVEDHEARIKTLELGGAGTISANLGNSPSQQDLADAWESAKGESPVAGNAIINLDTPGIQWLWLYNVASGADEWVQTGMTALEIATEAMLGGVLSSQDDGQVLVELDGTMSVNGWDALQNTVASNTTQIGINAGNIASNATSIAANANALEEQAALIQSLSDEMSELRERLQIVFVLTSSDPSWQGLLDSTVVITLTWRSGGDPMAYSGSPGQTLLIIPGDVDGNIDWSISAEGHDARTGVIDNPSAGNRYRVESTIDAVAPPVPNLPDFNLVFVLSSSNPAFSESLADNTVITLSYADGGDTVTMEGDPGQMSFEWQGNVDGNTVSYSIANDDFEPAADEAAVAPNDTTEIILEMASVVPPPVPVVYTTVQIIPDIDDPDYLAELLLAFVATLSWVDGNGIAQSATGAPGQRDFVFGNWDIAGDLQWRISAPYFQEASGTFSPIILGGLNAIPTVAMIYLRPPSATVFSIDSASNLSPADCYAGISWRT